MDGCDCPRFRLRELATWRTTPRGLPLLQTSEVGRRVGACERPYLTLMEPEPDTKDWTWTLTRRCESAAWPPARSTRPTIPERAFVAAEEWVAILRSSPAVRERPEPDVWSPLEYGAHVRDVYRLFDARLVQMLTEDEPTFANWDQDETAISAALRRGRSRGGGRRARGGRADVRRPAGRPRAGPALTPRSPLRRGRVHGGHLQPVLPARRRAPPLGRDRPAGRAPRVAHARAAEARRSEIGAAARLELVQFGERLVQVAPLLQQRGPPPARCRRSGTPAGPPRRGLVVHVDHVGDLVEGEAESLAAQDQLQPVPDPDPGRPGCGRAARGPAAPCPRRTGWSAASCRTRTPARRSSRCVPPRRRV